MNKNIFFFSGTTAEVIKLAPIINEFQNRKISFKFITSGQTRIRFEDLTGYIGNIEIFKSFPEKENKSSIFSFIKWFIKTFILALVTLRSEFAGLNKKNSYFIVHGDTISSLVGTMVAFIYGLKIVHIESGLRSYNFLEPFPEEICRFIIIHLADILFAPNSWAKSNLKNMRGVVVDTDENTVVESVRWALSSKTTIKNIVWGNKYYILTMHRQEHVLFKSKWTRETLEYVIKTAPKALTCVLVMHHWTNKFLKSLEISKRQLQKVIVIERLPYLDFIKLMNDAEFYAGDGCSNQEEAYAMGTPYLALRNLTERTEGLDRNVVISYDSYELIKEFLKNYNKYKKNKLIVKNSPSKIIVDYLVSN
ncbi:UDP-N-acetylglucosamine 2-epimerase [Candidatus Amesbacteria bacterium]|nr:UDP-N-acetylglucosamine 2-epimerase [Candidatus Amesbacteria bacterium]